MSNYQAEKIGEFLEEQVPGCGTHHTLFFDLDSGKFILESVGVEINEGDVEMTDMESDEALDWLTQVAGVPYMKAVRAIIGVDEDTPR